MSPEGKKFPACGHLPDLRRLVNTGGGHALARRADGKSVHPPPVPPENEELTPGHRIPNLCRLIVTTGHDTLAVRAEGHSPDGARVPFEIEEMLAGARVPHLCFPFIRGRPTGGGQALAVATEGHSRQSQHMAP